MRLRMLMIAILIPLPLWGQSGQAADAGVSLRLPSSISGEVVPADATSEGERSREWESTMEVGAGCDDNALPSSKDPVSDCTYSVRPSIAFRQAGSRSSWNLMYAPGFIGHQEFSSLNEMEHTLGIDAQHRFTRRLSVRVRESFVRSTNFLNRLNLNPDLPTFGLVHAPNEETALSAMRRTASTSGLESTYQLSRTSYVGLVVTYSDLQYENLMLGGTPLANEQVGSAGAVYSRLVGRRHWIGLNYNFQHLRSTGSEWAVAHSVLYTHTIVLGKHLAASAFIGPSYSGDHARILLSPSALEAVPSSSTRWNVLAGGSVEWSTPHTRLDATIARRVANGVGLTGPAVLNSGTLRYERQLNARLASSFNARVGDTSGLVSNPATILSNFQTVLLQAGLQYRLREHMMLRMYYERDWQDGGSGSNATHIKRNALGISLGYTFGGPLGKDADTTE